MASTEAELSDSKTRLACIEAKLSDSETELPDSKTRLARIEAKLSDFETRLLSGSEKETIIWCISRLEKIDFAKPDMKQYDDRLSRLEAYLIFETLARKNRSVKTFVNNWFVNPTYNLFAKCKRN